MAGNQTVGSLNVELTAATASFEANIKAAQASLDRFAAANNNVATKVASQSKVIQQAGLNISRQFTDIGVSLAGGASPFLVLTQQLPQVADAFAVAKQQGVGFKGVLGGLARGIAPAIPALAGIGAAAGVAIGAFALFERAVDKQTKGATTFGETWQATVNVIGKAIMDGPIGDGLKWLGTAVGKVLDGITSLTLGVLDTLVGQWGAAFDLITKNWRRLPEVLGVIIQAGANNVIRGVEFLVNGTISGLNVLLKAAGLGVIQAIDLPEIKLANKELAADFAATQKRISAGFKEGRGKFFGDIVKETERLHAANQKAKKSGGDHAKTLKEVNDAARAAAEAFKALEARARAFYEGLNKGLRDRGLTQLQKVQRDLREGLADVRDYGGDLRSVIVPAATLAAEVSERWAEAQQLVNVELSTTPANIGKIKSPLEDLVEEARDLADAFDTVQFSLDDIFSSLKSGNIGRLVLNIQGLASSIPQLLAQGPGGLASLGSIAANAIGGKAGRAIGGGLGIAASGLGLGAFAGSLTGGAALTAAGLGGLVGPLIAAAGPIGIAAGALYAAAKLLNVGGKPSNKGAGFDLVTGQLSGNKRSAETEEAARGAGEAILGIQDALKAAGIGLTDTVKGLVIGTRDASQIYLASGRMLTSAVGDSGAAVDTALRALLDGATYVSEAQRKLVESALATGKGFDAIAEVLAKYEAAQKISGELADRILALTDPKAFDLDQVKDAIAAERAAAEQLAKDGVLTADQLATINGQLAQLEALEIDAVLARYSEAVEDAGEAARRAAETQLDYAQGSWEEAVAALEASRDAEVAALEKTRDELLKTADSLADFRKDVLGEILGAGDPRRALAAARTAFAANTDPSRIPELGRALLSASQAGAANAGELARDRAAVLAAAQRAEGQARAEAGAIDREIAAIHLQVGALLPLTPAVQSLDTAIGKLQAAAEALATAQAAHAAAFAQAAQAMNDNLAAVSAAAAAGFDTAAASAALNPATVPGEAALGDAVVAAPEDVQLRQLVAMQGIMSILEDVTQGGDALQTVAA